MNIIQRIIDIILQLLGNQPETKPTVPAQPPAQPEPEPPTTEHAIPFDNLKQSTVTKHVPDLPLRNAPAQNIPVPEWSQISYQDAQPIPFDPITDA